MKSIDSNLLNTPIARIEMHVDRYVDACRGLGIDCDKDWVPLRPLFMQPEDVAGVEEGLKKLRTSLRQDEVLKRVLTRVPERYRGFAAQHFALSSHLTLMRPDLLGPTNDLAIIDLNVGSATSVTAFETDLMNAFYHDMLGDGLFGNLTPQYSASVVDAQATFIANANPGLEQILALTERGALEHDAKIFAAQRQGFVAKLERATSLNALDYVFPGNAPVRELLEKKTLLYPLGQFNVHFGAQMKQLDRFLKNKQGATFFTSPFDSLYEKWLLDELEDSFGELRKATTTTPKDIDANALDKNAWVLKHGDNAKWVFVGDELSEAQWQKAVQDCAEDEPWILQKRIAPVPAKLPFLREGAIVFDGVFPEYSPFMLDDKLIAIFVRFVPQSSKSTVVSPPPKNLGLGVAWAWAEHQFRVP